MTITPLPFDSALFGYSIGKCQASESWNQADFLVQAKDFQLVYVFSESQLLANSDQFFLADIKVTFAKALENKGVSDPDIQPFTQPLTDSLWALALESGVYSRFNTDPGFKLGEYEKLYRLWIQQALDQQEVLMAKDQAGFVSCSISGEKAQIGLIAVDRNQRGRGWGKRLVQAAERFAVHHQGRELLIGTQEANTPAVGLYQSLGYQLTERILVYHYRP
jgi:dTDP-4-amino-4,6-dideoxy-D-galactose acyltransferase